MATTLNTIALSNLGKHRVRFALTSLGIALSAFFLVAVLLLNASLSATLRAGSEPGYSKADFVISSTGRFKADFSLPQTVSPGVVQALEGVAAVDQVWAQATTYTYMNVVREDGIRARSYQERSDLPDSAAMFPFDIAEGTYPQSAQQVLIPRTLAEKYELSIGDTIELADLGKVVENQLYLQENHPMEPFTVSGIYTDSPFGDEQDRAVFTPVPGGSGVSVYDYASGFAQFNGGGTKAGYDQILITVDSDDEAARAQLQEALTPYSDTVLVSSAEQVTQEVGNRLGTATNFTIILLVFWLLALGLSVFIITNTFKVHAAARTRELALLRVLGARQGSLVGMLLLEASLLGGLSSLAGIAVAYLLAFALSFASTGFLLVFSPVAGLIALLVCVAATVLGALLPAWQTRSLSPVAALSPQVQPVTSTANGLTRTPLVVGLLLLALAGLVLLVWQGEPLGYVTATTLIAIGLVCLFPLATHLGSRALIRWATPYSSLHLAASNIRQSPTQAMVVGRIIFTCAAILAAMLTGAGTVQQSVTHEIESSIPFGVEAPAQLETLDAALRLQERAQQIPQVKAAVVAYPQASIASDEAGNPDLTVYSADLDQVLEAGPDSWELDDPGSTMLVGQELAENNGWNQGSKVKVTGTQQGSQELTVHVVPQDLYMPLIPREVGRSVSGNSSIVSGSSDQAEGKLLLSFTPDASDNDQKAALTQIEELTGSDQLGFAGHVTQTRSVKRDMTTVMTTVLGLLGAALLISLIGIANTQVLSAYQRRRPYSLLRAAGMSTVTLRKVISLETVLIASTAVLLGILAGIATGLLLLQSIEDLDLTYTVNILGLLLVAVGGLALAWLTALIPAVRASRYPPVKALAETAS